MYSIVLASLLVPAVEAPARGHHGGRGGGGCYSAGCWGGCWGGGWGGCWGGGWGGCYGGCSGFGGYPIIYSGSCMGGGGMVISGGGQGGGQGGGGQGGGGQGGGYQEGGGQGGGGQGGYQEGGGHGSGSHGLGHQVRELKKSVEELRKQQTQQRIDMLKMIAEELKNKATEQTLNEIRRDVEWLKHRAPAGVTPGPVPLPMPLPSSSSKPGTILPTPRTSKIELQLPADALLHVNDEKVDLAASFVTPDLQPGEDYYYDIDVSYVRDGKSLTRGKRVTIRAGEVVRLSLEDMQPAQWSALPGRDRGTASASLARSAPSARTALTP